MEHTSIKYYVLILSLCLMNNGNTVPFPKKGIGSEEAVVSTPKTSCLPDSKNCLRNVIDMTINDDEFSIIAEYLALETVEQWISGTYKDQCPRLFKLLTGQKCTKDMFNKTSYGLSTEIIPKKNSLLIRMGGLTAKLDGKKKTLFPLWEIQQHTHFIVKNATLKLLRDISKNKNLTTLDLANNHLGWTESETLVQMFSALPAKLTTLNLTWNDLGRMPYKALVQVFSALPAKLTTLNLRDNDLGQMRYEALVQMFSALPAKLTTLNLTWNNLGSDIEEKLKAEFPDITFRF